MTDLATAQLWIRTAVGGDELRSLHDWLLHDDGLRGRVRLVHSDVVPGQMGGVLDALVVAVGSGGMGAVLAGSLSTWISQRRSDVKITVTNSDGVEIELDGKRVDAETVIREVGRLLSSEGPPQ
ncbi:effector-associated constant component EACC1 [Nocardia sp. CA-119907]|uniref:effector-associated constant component EACC1 n=1 Tax=Nocardia sp. CA-119907 TaxID=3239973 RepID=UPI003D96AC64